jgi:protein involved in polysaccharide export with SLBB domain
MKGLIILATLLTGLSVSAAQYNLRPGSEVTVTLDEQTEATFTCAGRSSTTQKGVIKCIAKSAISGNGRYYVADTVDGKILTEVHSTKLEVLKEIKTLQDQGICK